MKKAIINGKEYDFLFNANTPELFYQVFGEDLLLELALSSSDLKNAANISKLSEKEQLEAGSMFLKKNRIAKLAFITNMQAQKTIAELSNRLTYADFMTWQNAFALGTFYSNTEVITAVVTGWSESMTTTSEVKNQGGQQ